MAERVRSKRCGEGRHAMRDGACTRVGCGATTTGDLFGAPLDASAGSLFEAGEAQAAARGVAPPVAGDLDSYRGSDGAMHARLRLGPDDLTPTVRTCGTGATRRYAHACAGCWGGNAHSEAYHDTATMTAEEAAAWLDRVGSWPSEDSMVRARTQVARLKVRP